MNNMNKKVLTAAALAAALAGASLIARELKKINFNDLDFNYEFQDDEHVYDLSEEANKKD